MLRKKKDKLDVENLNEVIWTSRKILKIFYILVIFALVGIGMFLLRETKVLALILKVLKVMSPLFIGIIVAWILDPLVSWFVKKGVKRVIASIFAFFVLLFAIYLLSILIFPRLGSQLNDFITLVPSIFTSIYNWIDNIFDKLSSSSFDFSGIKTQIYSSISQISADITTKLPTSVVNFVTSLVSGIGTFLLGLIVGFYLLIDFNAIKKVLEFVPKKYHESILEITSRVNDSFRDFLQGTLLVSLGIFILSLIGYSAVGLKAPMLFALLCAITNIIPYIGPWLGGAICAIVGFTVSPLCGILTVVVAFVIQQIDGIILNPLIMGKTMKLHPVSIMIGLLVFGSLFGIWGMILATPIMGGVKTILNYFDEKYDLITRFKKNNIDEEPEEKGKEE